MEKKNNFLPGSVENNKVWYPVWFLGRKSNYFGCFGPKILFFVLHFCPFSAYFSLTCPKYLFTLLATPDFPTRQSHCPWELFGWVWGSYIEQFGNKCPKGDVTWQKNYPFLGKKHKKVLFLASPSFLVVLFDTVLLKISKNGFQIMKIEELIRSFQKNFWSLKSTPSGRNLRLKKDHF